MLLYKDDLSDPDRRRKSEQSDRVVRFWAAPRDFYEPEFDTAAGCDAYFRLTAERMLYRSKIIGLSLDPVYLGNERLMATSFIEGKTPALSELLNSDVCVGMVYVPLTPHGSTGRSVLARLYCVSGLSRRYFPVHMLRDDLLPGMSAYSWFITGLPDDKFDEAIDGRSWLLAAELLMRVVEKRDVSTIRNLARHFIVTGDICKGQIRRVEMGRKDELARRPVLRNFKWIIPKENEMSIPLPRIKKFENLDAAYDFIETMRNQETVNLAKMAKSSDRYEDRDFLGFLKNGADPSESVSDLDTNARQRVMSSFESTLLTNNKRIAEALRSGGVSEVKIRNLLSPIADAIIGFLGKDRILSYYGGIPQMFFLFAKQGDEAMLDLLQDRGFYINATDNTGATALDFAYESGEDPSVIERLEKRGCRRRVFEPGSDDMQNAIRTITEAGSRKFLLEALEHGFSPNYEFVFLEDEEWVDSWPETYMQYDPKEDDDIYERTPLSCETWACAWRRYSTTLLLEAIIHADEELALACFKHGGTVQTTVKLAYDRQLERKDYYTDEGKPPVINKIEWNFDPQGMMISEFINSKNNLSKPFLTSLRQKGDL